jgi:hypothetical protein
MLLATLRSALLLQRTPSHKNRGGPLGGTVPANPGFTRSCVAWVWKSSGQKWSGSQLASTVSWR